MQKFVLITSVIISISLMINIGIHYDHTKILPVNVIYAQTNDMHFDKNFKAIVSETNLITAVYETEIGKWKNKQISNSTIITITNEQIIKLENLIKRLDSFPKNEENKNITDLYAKSLENEIESNIHFKNYLLTNDPLEKKLSSEYLSRALEYEVYSFAEFNKIYQ